MKLVIAFVFLLSSGFSEDVIHSISDRNVQSSERTDLNQEALAIAQQWTFTSAMCNIRPDAHEVDFTLKFQGR